jgi:septal ring factor EnvC (AmiA/AmiB activator)
MEKSKSSSDCKLLSSEYEELKNAVAEMQREKQKLEEELHALRTAIRQEKEEAFGSE